MIGLFSGKLISTLNQANKLTRSFLVENQKMYYTLPWSLIMLTFHHASLKNITFEEHYKTILDKTNKTIRHLPKLQSLLPRVVLINIYKTFVRSHQTMVMFSMIKHLKLRSWKTRIHSVQCLSSFNWSNKEHLQRKSVSGIRYRLTSNPLMVQKALSLI